MVEESCAFCGDDRCVPIEVEDSVCSQVTMCAYHYGEYLGGLEKSRNKVK